MKYPIKAKEGLPIPTTSDGAIPLHGIKDILDLATKEDQITLFDKLGITFLSDGTTVTFKERGQAYEIPEEDRNVIEINESELSFHIVFGVVIDRNKFPLKMSMNLDHCTGQPFVNFLGEICFHNHENRKIIVPLTGRGTVALEGKINDAHAGLCTSGTCSSFQDRVAILSCILASMPMTRDDIEIFRTHLLKICSRFLGTEDILSYTIDRAFDLTNESYFDYMQSLYADKNEEEVPVMLNHFTDFGEPHPLYFYELTSHLTSEEVDNEFKDISSETHGPDLKPISFKVRDIVNKFILSDDIYLVKPYAGTLSIMSGNDNIDIYGVSDELNSNSMERTLGILEKIGVTITDDIVMVSFAESGKRYADKMDKSNINVSDNISEEIFQLSLKRKSQNVDALLKLKMFLDIQPTDNINFFGKIEIRHTWFKKLVIPLVGRGTIALDGSLNDKHRGFCTSRECASFLQRVAIIYSSLVLLDLDPHDLVIFETNIKSINDKFHGRHQIVDYIFKVGKEEETENFFEYMKKTNMNYSAMPIVLKTILTYNRLPSRYYEDLISNYTEEELLKEEDLFDKSRSMGFFFGAVHQARLFLKNMDIF